MQLTKHFTLEEFTASALAVRLGIDNTPNAKQLARITLTAQRMEAVRDVLCVAAGEDIPIHLTSGFRCLALNRALRSSDASAHVDGDASDFKAPKFGGPLKVARALEASSVGYDQLIHEFGAWVHISFADRLRGETLTIDRVGDRVRTRAGLLPIG